MENKFTNWEDFEKELKITSEEELEIQLEMDLIKAVIDTRKKSKLTQRDLSKKSGIKQPVIARIESNINSPHVSTLIKILYPMGYTLRVVPIRATKKEIED